METRADYYEKSCIAEIINEQNLVKLGWVPVPSIDGSNCYSWADVTTKMKNNGLSAMVRGDWASEPVVIRNQRLFTVDANFLKNISSVKSGVRLILNVRKNWKCDCADRVYGPISSLDTNFTAGSSAWSFNLDGLITYSMPRTLTLTKLDGILSFGPWFTAGHVETGGDDSITYVPVGKKLMLVAKRGRASQRLEALFTSWKAIAELLSKPPARAMRENVRFFISNPDALMIQPSLCAHCVITFNDGPALVVGFEGKDEADPKRRSQVINYYATGLGVERREILLRKYSDKQALASLSTSKKTKTSLFEHLECFQYDGVYGQASSPRKAKVKCPKRKRRMLFRPRIRVKYQQKVSKKKGMPCFCSQKNEVV